MKRRDFLRSGAMALAAPGLRDTGLYGLSQMGQMAMPPQGQPSAVPMAGPPADITLRIEPVTVELAPDRILSTIGYNGTSPGPILRMKEGKPVTVDVINRTDTPELVHWHGFLISPETDGVEEQGARPIPPQGTRRLQFTPALGGSRWYHTHAMAESDLHKGAYTGQFGFVYVDPASGDPGHYDQEHFLALRDWEPFFSSTMEDDDDEDGKPALQPEKPTRDLPGSPGLEVSSMTYSINDKSLGAGHPIRVKQGDRVLFHLLNASAIENRRIAFAGHKFRIIAMDGNPVPTPVEVDAIFLGAGERVCAVVEMNNPGVWILGATNDMIRNAGLGIIVEYANQHKKAVWAKPGPASWDYTIFGKPGAPAQKPDAVIDMVFEKMPSGMGKFNAWLINGKPYPHEREFVLEQGKRYRLIYRNRTDDAHPMHLHRHQTELVEINGKWTHGLIKDTVVVPYFGRASVDFVADQPGLTLFHCHIQNHMDYGFKALFRYA
ncbi:multicopper oxidase family protein [Terriglobus albidus]|uniref:Multicopper oxidase family protein n=1 Tax=Terriglobus albidus TaxID=1592106 RepID=A0A5B9EGB8_9BACT|nr:multicopper oxidase family protein [Terriglobus albidus]QEE29106.1 multicopper oxidase family protein [Terriglobus albidus]